MSRTAAEVIEAAVKLGYGSVMMTPYETTLRKMTIISRGFIQAASLDSQRGIEIVERALTAGAEFPELDGEKL